MCMATNFVAYTRGFCETFKHQSQIDENLQDYWAQFAMQISLNYYLITVINYLKLFLFEFMADLLILNDRLNHKHPLPHIHTNSHNIPHSNSLTHTH